MVPTSRKNPSAAPILLISSLASTNVLYPPGGFPVTTLSNPLVSGEGDSVDLSSLYSGASLPRWQDPASVGNSRRGLEMAGAEARDGAFAGTGTSARAGAGAGRPGNGSEAEVWAGACIGTGAGEGAGTVPGGPGTRAGAGPGASTGDGTGDGAVAEAALGFFGRCPASIWVKM